MFSVFYSHKIILPLENTRKLNCCIFLPNIKNIITITSVYACFMSSNYRLLNVQMSAPIRRIEYSEHFVRENGVIVAPQSLLLFLTWQRFFLNLIYRL